MTQVFFYHGANHRINAATALIAKAYAQKKSVLIYAPPETANALSQSLWTRNPISFIPHTRVDSPLAAETPVIITTTLPSALISERLINLSDTVPDDFSRFARIIEIIGNDTDKIAARERFKFYKQQACNIESIDLTGKS